MWKWRRFSRVFPTSSRLVTSSSPESTRGNRTSLNQKFQGIPPHDVNTSGGSGSVPESGASPKDLIVELELARSDVRRLTLDKERLLEMSNTLRAELEFSTRATSEGDESEGDRVDTVELKHKSVFASVGLTMSGSQIKKGSVGRVFNKSSERSATSQKTHLKSTQQRVLQRRAVRKLECSRRRMRHKGLGFVMHCCIHAQRDDVYSIACF